MRATNCDLFAMFDSSRIGTMNASANKLFSHHRSPFFDSTLECSELGRWEKPQDIGLGVDQKALLLWYMDLLMNRFPSPVSNHLL